MSGSPIISPAFPQGSFPVKMTGAKRKRGQEMEIVSTAPSQMVRTITRVPLKRRKGNPYAQLHNFKRTFDVGASTMVTDPLNPTFFAFNFSMNDMPGYTELTALFDFYKLKGVRVRALPYLQDMSNSVSSLNNVRNPPIFYAIDRSDSTAPSTVAEVLEYQDHKISSVWKGFDVYIRSPKFADATSAVRGGWVATSNATLNWFGLKVAIPATGVSTQFYLVFTFYVSCKDPK